jgi:hypothetical protein
MSGKYVILILFVNACPTFRCLDIDVCHTGIVGNCLPEYISLIMGDVYAMDMRTCILTLYTLGECKKW